MTPAQRDQLLGHLARVRLVLFVLLADPTVSALVHQWAVRVPLIGVVVWACEIIVRTVRPTQAAQPDVIRRPTPDVASPAADPVAAPPYAPPAPEPVVPGPPTPAAPDAPGVT